MGRVYESIEDQLTERIMNASNADKEEFLGYEISADVLENLEDRIREVLNQMPEEEMMVFEKKYGPLDTYEAPQGECYVTFKVEGRYVAKIRKNTSLEELRKEAAASFSDANFGELTDIEGEDIIIEDNDGNFIWER